MQPNIKRVFPGKWGKRLGIGLFTWFCLHIAYILADGLQPFSGQADVAIILGNRVFADGSLSPWLQGRVDRAVQLYRNGRVKKIFASGGMGTDEDQHYPEGDAMKAYLIRQGIPAADIIADNQGQNTFLTAKDFVDWNHSRHYSSAVVVSQFYHITRSKYILRKLGCKNVYSAASARYSMGDIMGTLREVPALYKYMIAY